MFGFLPLFVVVFPSHIYILKSKVFVGDGEMGCFPRSFFLCACFF